MIPQLIGAWKLLVINYSNGTTAKTNPLGRIVFTADGYMNAMVTYPDKFMVFPNGTTWAGLNDTQVASVTKSIVAYSGPCRLENRSGEIFTHVAVEISVNPTWIGTNQVRHASLEEKGGKTILSLNPYTVSDTLGSSRI